MQVNFADEISLSYSERS